MSEKPYYLTWQEWKAIKVNCLNPEGTWVLLENYLQGRFLLAISYSWPRDYPTHLLARVVCGLPAGDFNEAYRWCLERGLWQ